MRLIKPDLSRGLVFDKLVEAFGDQVLGMYEGNLRIETIDDETGEINQFSIKVTKGKTLLDDIECDEYVPINVQLENYEQAVADKMAKAEAKKRKKQK